MVIVNFLLLRLKENIDYYMLDFFLNPGFWVWGTILDHFQNPQIDLKVKNSLYGLYEVKENFVE